MTNDREKLRREDEGFATRVGHRLRSSADELDGQTLSRLNRARQVALEEMDHSAVGHDYKHILIRRDRWLPIGAVVMLAIVSVTLWQRQVSESDVTSIVADEVTDIEILLDDGDLEMYEELEFFAWLSEDELENIG